MSVQGRRHPATSPVWRARLDAAAHTARLSTAYLTTPSLPSEMDREADGGRDERHEEANLCHAPLRAEGANAIQR